MSSSGIVKNIPNLTSASDAAETIIRPKIMRRPAQLSSPSPVIIVQSPLLNTPAEKAEITPEITAKPWQDDGRFAIALVLVLVIINLLASTWLRPTPSHVDPAASQARKATPDVTILNELNPPESNQ